MSRSLRRSRSRWGEGGENLSDTAKQIAQNVAQQAEPKAAELNRTIEEQAHEISQNAEPWAPQCGRHRAGGR